MLADGLCTPGVPTSLRPLKATFGVGGVAGFVAAANEAPGELVMLAGQAAAHHQDVCI